jgi:hypothetical protein
VFPNLANDKAPVMTPKDVDGGDPYLVLVAGGRLPKTHDLQRQKYMAKKSVPIQIREPLVSDIPLASYEYRNSVTYTKL